MTMQGFISKHRIKAESKMVDRNPNMAADEDWSRQAHHYKVTISGVFHGRRKRLTTYFSMGSAFCKDPEAGEVLDCLASDAAGFENAQGFEDWASEYGYDTDSRKAERTYKAVEKATDRLKAFLPPDDYKALLWDTERL